MRVEAVTPASARITYARFQSGVPCPGREDGRTGADEAGGIRAGRAGGGLLEVLGTLGGG